MCWSSSSDAARRHLQRRPTTPCPSTWWTKWSARRRDPGHFLLAGRTLKSFLPGGDDGEVLLQTHSVPVSELVDQGLDASQITGIAIVVDGAVGHRVYLDDVGVRRTG